MLQVHPALGSREKKAKSRYPRFRCVRGVGGGDFASKDRNPPPRPNLTPVTVIPLFFARTAGNRFARDDKEPGPSWGKQLPGERPRETAET
jgi:hypothetical protein